jgi:hypothetical protein
MTGTVYVNQVPVLPNAMLLCLVYPISNSTVPIADPKENPKFSAGSESGKNSCSDLSVRIQKEKEAMAGIHF